MLHLFKQHRSAAMSILAGAGPVVLVLLVLVGRYGGAANGDVIRLPHATMMPEGKPPRDWRPTIAIDISILESGEVICPWEATPFTPAKDRNDEKRLIQSLSEALKANYAVRVKQFNELNDDPTRKPEDNIEVVIHINPKAKWEHIVPVIEAVTAAKIKKYGFL